MTKNRESKRQTWRQTLTGRSSASFHSGPEDVAPPRLEKRCLRVFDCVQCYWEFKRLLPPLLVGKDIRRKEEQPVRVRASKAEASWWCSNVRLLNHTICLALFIFITLLLRKANSVCVKIQIRCFLQLFEQLKDKTCRSASLFSCPQAPHQESR